MHKKHEKLVDDFEKWVQETDPLGLLTKEEQADCFLKQKQLLEQKDCMIELGLIATENSVQDLNKFLKMANVKEKLQVGQGIKLMYKINLGLEGLVPSNHDGLKKMLEFFHTHPDALLVNQEDKNKLLDHMEKWLMEADAWFALVASVTKSFEKVFALHEIAANKAFKEANKNEVVIE